MKTRLLLVALALAVLTAGSAWGKVEGKEVEYRAGETVLKGYLALDTRYRGRRPAVLVVHEWWGHNDYARRRAEMLARQGYIALAVDMFGNGKTALATDSPARPGAVKARVLVFTGEDDAMVPAAQVTAFSEEMKKAVADFRVVTYPGIKHGFTNPEANNLARKFNLPLSYNFKADQDS